MVREPPIYVSSSNRAWKRLDSTVFRSAIAASSLCDAGVWSVLDVDDLAQLYNNELTSILDSLVPVHTVKCRQRASDAWFDDDCRAAKRKIRLLERHVRQKKRSDQLDSVAINAATEIWSEERRQYRILLRRKREEFWQA